MGVLANSVFVDFGSGAGRWRGGFVLKSSWEEGRRWKMGGAGRKEESEFSSEFPPFVGLALFWSSLRSCERGVEGEGEEVWRR